MSEFLTDEEQLAQVRDWWKENRAFIISGVVLGVAILFGVNYYKDMKRTRGEQASFLYEELLTAMNARDRQSAVAAADRLGREFGATAYADQAPLALAKLFVDSGDTEAAVHELTKALDAEGEIGTVARLRLARLRLAIGDAAQALELLASGEPGDFAPLFDEVRGDAHQALGDAEAARDAYRSALEADAVGLDRAFVQMKLDALGLPEEDA